MKYLFALLPLLSFLLFSCSNDLNVTSDWKEIPVAYGILSPKDTAHYIRIEKGFLDPERDARLIAQIPDSLYYPENTISVFLERVSNGQRYPMKRVDGNLEGYVRDNGVFADQPNYLYKVRNADIPGGGLKPSEKYRLVIERNDGKPNITAQVALPRDIVLAGFNSLKNTPPTLDLAPPQGQQIDMDVDSNALYFNVIVQIRVREVRPALPDTTYDIRWPAVKNYKRSTNPVGGNNTFQAIPTLVPNDFFLFLTQTFPPSSTKQRYFQPFSVTIEGGGGKTLENFYATASVASSITSAEVVPTYSNLSEGYGLLLSKTSLTVNNVLLNSRIVDTLNARAETRDLNFRK